MSKERFVWTKTPRWVWWWGTWWRDLASEVNQPLPSLSLAPETRRIVVGVRLVADWRPRE